MQFCICFRFEMHQDVITHGNILMNYTGKNFELYLPSRAQFVDLKKPWREPINQQQKIRPSERTNNHSYLPTYLPPPFAHWSFSRNVHVANMKMIELFWMEWNVVWRNSYDLISNFCDRHRRWLMKCYHFVRLRISISCYNNFMQLSLS